MANDPKPTHCSEHCTCGSDRTRIVGDIDLEDVDKVISRRWDPGRLFPADSTV